MSSATRDALLKLALPLIKNHGFTRSALSLAVMYSPSGKHTAPLNDTAVDALFGKGDEARRTLIRAWLDDARVSLRESSYSQGGASTSTGQTPSLENVLKTRLSKNEDVLTHLPEVSTVPNSMHSRSSCGVPIRPGVRSSRHTPNAILTHLPANPRSSACDLSLNAYRRRSMPAERRHKRWGKTITINLPIGLLRFFPG